MTEQTLFQSYKDYLLKLQKFFEKEKQNFIQIKTPNKDSDYEKIVKEANQKAIAQLDAAIQQISKFVETLEVEKQRKIQIARDNRPSKQSKS